VFTPDATGVGFAVHGAQAEITPLE
jgi:hypothetical protein